VALIGVVGAAALTWVVAFETGSVNGDWNAEWSSPSETRGNTVYIGNGHVETTEEREKRLAPAAKDLRDLKDDLGTMKRSVLGDGHKTRGDDVRGEHIAPPPGYDFNPREACQHMQMTYPERYKNVDCMSDKYNSSEPWWQ
jgi:hypothetical protein